MISPLPAKTSRPSRWISPSHAIDGKKMTGHQLIDLKTPDALAQAGYSQTAGLMRALQVDSTILKGLKVTKVELHSTQGLANRTFCISTEGEAEYFVRAYRTRYSYQEGDTSLLGERYRKERFGLLSALRAGALVPSINEVGVIEEFAISVAPKMDGASAASTISLNAGDREALPQYFGDLGAQLKKVAEVQTTGFGRYFVDGTKSFSPIPNGKEAGTWDTYLDALIAESDLGTLLEKGFISPREEKILKIRVDRLRQASYEPRLAHGEATTGNVLLSSGRLSALLDGETVCSGPSPHMDLVPLLFYTEAMDIYGAKNDAQEHARMIVEAQGIPYNADLKYEVDTLVTLSALNHASWYFEYFLTDQTFPEKARSAHAQLLQNVQSYIHGKLHE